MQAAQKQRLRIDSSLAVLRVDLVGVNNETEPVFLNVYGAPELIPRNAFRIPPAYVAWWAGTITLFLLGSYAPRDF